MSTVYRDRGVRDDRDWDTKSARGDDRKRTTIRRYHVQDDDDDVRSVRSDRHDTRDEREELKIHVSRGEQSATRTRPSNASVYREKDREHDYYERDYRRDDRNGHYRREPERSSDDRFEEIRITRNARERSPSPELQREPELQRYTRQTEYFRDRSPPQPIYIRTEAPQPIIIREPARQQIVIRERTPEPRYEEPERAESVHESVHESKQDARSQYATSERQISRREPSPEPEEDYYYEKRVRRVQRQQEERPEPRREKQRDASEESFYYRKTEEGYESDEHGPKHRRHIAEGALAGGALAALASNRRRGSGEGGRGRAVAQTAGGAVLGGLATEAITRARSHYRSKSRVAERDLHKFEDDARGYGGRRGYDERGGGHGDSRESSRESSPDKHSNLKKLGALAAVGALAGYAINRARSKKAGSDTDDRRSRSRHRRGSRTRDMSASDSGSGGDKKSGIRSNMAKAGLAAAAAAGLVERARSQERGPRERSKSRVRQALPVAAAGLGGAALAGLYTKNKEGKKKSKGRDRSRSDSGSRDRSMSRDRPQSRDRSRSRSRARGGIPVAGEYADSPSGGDQNLIEYGTGPAPGHARGGSGRDSMYDGRRRGSEGSSPRRLRSRSRGDPANFDEPGRGAYDAHQRRERKRAERAQRQQEEDRNETPQEAPGYGFGPYAQAAPEPPPMQEPFQPQPGYYPQGGNFAPPPIQNPYSPTPNIVGGQAPYQPPPQEYPINPSYGPPDANPYGPPAGQGPYRNVSYTSQRYLPINHQLIKAPSSVGRPKSVLFDVSPEQARAHTPGLAPRAEIGSRDLNDGSQHYERSGSHHEGGSHRNDRDDAGLGDKKRRRRRRRHSAEGNERRRKSSTMDGSQDTDNDKGRGKQRRRARSASPASDDSGQTVDLPPRFDKDGRKKPERGDNQLADQIEAIVGNGRMGS